MVERVTRGMNGADGGPFDFEDLAVGDWLLGATRAVFVDGVGEVWIDTEEVRYATGMVTVPVGEQGVGEGNVGGFERGRD